MTAILHDLRYALRQLARSPGFAAVAIGTLALGIGANAAMFAVVDAVLLKPLPFAEPERLMLVHLLRPDTDAGPQVFRETVWSYPKYRSFVARQQVLEDSALFSERDVTLTGDDSPQRLRGEVVTERYPGVLGIAPSIGRPFTFEEANREGESAVAMISYGLWTARYGADPAIGGRTIQINGQPFVVVGVLPQGFRGLSGDADLWVPIPAIEPTELTEATNHSFRLIARRRADMTEPEALANIRVAGDQAGTEFSEAESATAASLYGSRADADVRRIGLLLLGAVGFVLLIACVNLTNLLVAKTLGRRREVAIRVAIGASRSRVARQLFVESAVLAGFGALGGLLIASVALSAGAMLLPDADVFLSTSIAPGVPRTQGAAGLTRIGAGMIGLDGTTLWFTAVVTAVAAGLVAIVLATRASSFHPIEGLKTGGSASSPGRRGVDAGATLLVAQIALVVVLLTGAGLMVRSGIELVGTSIGVDPTDVLTVRVDLPNSDYAQTRGNELFARLLERVRALPGVDSASMASCPPVSGGCNATGMALGPVRPDSDYSLPVGIHWATPGHLATLGASLLAGRDFGDGDRAGQPKVALVNETAARAYWPNDTPIGKVIAVGQGGFHDGAEVVGVVSNVRYRAIESAAGPDVYIPLAQSYRSRLLLFVRGRNPQSLVAAISTIVGDLDPNVPLSDVKSLDVRFGDAMWRTRVGAWLLSAFAGLALLLTAIGIFGVMAQSVAQRTAEIGVRMALGAQSREVLRLMLGRAALVTVTGIVLGTVCGLAITRLMSALLYGVPAHDPPTFVAAALLLGLIALGASYIPARRATRVDVTVALRNE